MFLGVKDFDPKKEPFYRRFFTGNVLLWSVWSWYFPTLIDFVFPILGLEVWMNSGFTASKYNYDYVYIACIAGMTVIVYVMFFFVYSVFPENLRQNKGRGPDHAGYYLSLAWVPIALYRLVMYRSLSVSVHEEKALSTSAKDAVESGKGVASPLMLAKLQDQTILGSFMDTTSTHAVTCSQLSRRLMGSDLTVSLFLYLLCSLIGCAYSVIMAFDNYDSVAYIGGLICTFIYTFGVVFTWYGCYPHRLRQDNFAGSYDIAYACVWMYDRLRGSEIANADAPERSSDTDNKLVNSTGVQLVDASPSVVEAKEADSGLPSEMLPPSDVSSDTFGIGPQ